MDFLLSRRSRPAKTLSDAAPDRASLERILMAAARSPDHGKLEPWRFIVLSREAMARIAGIATTRAAERGMDEAQATKAAAAFGQGGVIVAVLFSPKEAKIPAWEQAMSAGAVCLALLNAALASGWGANWLTGPFADDPAFVASALGGAPGEYVAGFIHIGGETVVPADRPRPDLDGIVTWL
ncbi:MAG: nitroreductase family protein [Pseudomonadota bacterium]